MYRIYLYQKGEDKIEISRRQFYLVSRKKAREIHVSRVSDRFYITESVFRDGHIVDMSEIKDDAYRLTPKFIPEEQRLHPDKSSSIVFEYRDGTYDDSTEVFSGIARKITNMILDIEHDLSIDIIIPEK